MAVQEQTPYKEFIANGRTTLFPLEFDCEKKDHLIVMIDSVVVDSSIWSLEAGQVAFTTAPSVDKKISILRNTPFERMRNYRSYDNSFRPDPVNSDFDVIWLKLQELRVSGSLTDSDIENLKQNTNAMLDEAIANGAVSSLAITTVNSLLELNSISKWNGRTAYVKGLQGGSFIYNDAKSDVNDGGIIFNGWVRQWDNLNLSPEFFGAKGDGLTNDVEALQAALNFISSTDWDTSVAVMSQKGGGLNLILSAKKYRFTKTLWIGAYTTIKGSGSLGFMNAEAQETSSVLYADLDDPNTAAISTSNFKSAGERIAFDELSSGSAYDHGLVSATHGIDLSGFSVISAQKTHIGIRIQNSPQSNVALYLEGFDYGLLVNASWQSNFDCRTLSYKCGALFLNDNNGVSIDGYYNSLEGIPLGYKNFIDFFSADTDVPGSFNDANTKFGVVSRYSYGLNSSTLICEHSTVGLFVGNGGYSCQTLYTEANTLLGFCSFTAETTINDWVGAFDLHDFMLGANAKLSIGSISKSRVLNSIYGISRWNTVLSVPNTYNFYAKSIEYQGSRNIVHVSTTGNDANNGLTESTAVRTIDEAMRRITNEYDQHDSAIIRPKTQKYTIILDNAGVYSVNNLYYLHCDLDIKGISGVSQSLKFESDFARFYLNNSKVLITNCDIEKADVIGTVENACFWTTNGENTVSFTASDINIRQGGLVYCDYAGNSAINILINNAVVTGGANSVFVQGNYLNTSPHIVNLIRSGGSVSPAILSRADKGISVPSTWQNKILGI